MFCSIGKFSELTGLSVHTLRYYEQEGLLSPARSQANRRVYTERDAAWAAFIRRLKETGMPLREIRRFAQLRAQGEATTSARLAMLIDHQARLSGQIFQLQEHQRALEGKMDWYRKALEESGES
jgi:DNA-binding transcriptional MerR regulator